MDRKERLIFRSQFTFFIRTFFRQNDFIEFETPVRLITPANEDYIDAIESEGQWLRTSPELHMKRLLCEGFNKIFQLGVCFRKGEFGRLHRQEFSMLEWYETDKDYLDTFRLIQYLCKFLSDKLEKRQKYFCQSWQVLSLKKAFDKFADISLQESMEKGHFEEVLTNQVEQHLGKDCPTIIIDYPVSMAAMSCLKDNDPTLAQRWELYIDGIEIANAYTELNDAIIQRQRFEESIVFRQKNGRSSYPLDEKFLQDLESMPPCTGIAVGIDRFCLVYLEGENLEDVLAFSE